MNRTAVSVNNLVFRYLKNGKRNILDHLSLDIPESGITVIAGSSGCGKSTLAAVFCGLYPENGGYLENGEITIFGEKLENLSIQKRASLITMMFQNPDLQFCMNTLRKEMRFCLENICVPKDSMDGLIEASAKKLGVESLLDRKLADLSGGEKQKAALACLFLMDSRCIVLDEAFANIDESSALEIIAILVKMRDAGKTIIAIDHRLDLWLENLDEIIVLGKPALEDGQGNGGAKVLARGIDRNNIGDHEELFRKEGLYFPKKDAYTASDARAATVFNGSDSTGCSITSSQGGASSRNGAGGYAPDTTGGGEDILQLQDFEVSLKDGRVLIHAQDENFRKGRMAAVLGPSGCGKTTAFLAILKQHQYSGKIILDGTDLSRIKKNRLYDQVGIVFQNPGNQFISQNVLEEVCSSIRISNSRMARKQDEAEVTAKAEALLADFDLYRYRKYSPYMLSQGQQRRLAVISVLSGSQKLLLLDEPTYGQDYKATMRIMELLQRKISGDGLSVIFITHDRLLADAYADSIHIVKEKKLELLNGNR